MLDEPKLALFWALSTLFTALAAALVFGVAFAAMAACRLDGEPVTVRAGIGCARRRIRSIAGWAALSTGVGLGLADLRQMRGGWLATRAASWLLGLVWVVTTFFAVPLLTLEDTGPVETVSRSASLVRRRWGEGVTGGTSMASVAGLLLVPIYILFVGTGVVFAASPPAGLAMLVCALLALLAAFSFLTALNQGSESSSTGTRRPAGSTSPSRRRSSSTRSGLAASRGCAAFSGADLPDATGSPGLVVRERPAFLSSAAGSARGIVRAP